MNVPDDHTFGIIVKPDGYGVDDILHGRVPKHYLRGKDRERALVAAVRQNLKNHNFNRFDDIAAAFNHYDKVSPQNVHMLNSYIRLILYSKSNIIYLYLVSKKTDDANSQATQYFSFKNGYASKIRQSVSDVETSNIQQKFWISLKKKLEKHDQIYICSLPSFFRCERSFYEKSCSTLHLKYISYSSVFMLSIVSIIIIN